MGKLGLLINNLQELHNNGASEDKLVAVSLEILAELTTPHIHQTNSEKVSVIMPSYYVTEHVNETIPINETVVNEAPVIISVEEYKVAENIAENVEAPIELTNTAPVVEETEETIITPPIPVIHEVENVEDTIHRIMEAPILPFETYFKSPLEEINSNESKQVFELKDTLSDDEETFNDKLKEEHSEINHQIKLEPVKDIKKAFNINEKYVFINELFRGDDAMFERSLKTINAFHIYPEAEYWIQRELKVKLGWNDSSTTVQHFDMLVKRRFAS